MEKRIPIGIKYTRLVGLIEQAFKASDKEILCSSEITHWVAENYPRQSMSQRRITALLSRRPQFTYHTSARRINSNVRDHWYSLGPSDETIFIEMNWVEYQPDKMSKRHRPKRKRCIMFHCKKRFTPGDNPKLHRPEMGHRVCRLDACVSMQNSIDSGDSDMPTWHPDYEDPTKDEDYMRLASTDDLAINDEKLREATTEAQRQRRARLPPHERRIAEERLTGKSYPENQVILNYDDKVVAKFNTPGERARAFQLAEHKHKLLKSQFDKKIKERLNKRSG